MTLEKWVNTDNSVANTIDYTYDKASNLLTVNDDFSSLTWTYDARDRVATESNVGTPGAPEVLLEYTYDAVGNVLSVTDTIDGTSGAVTTYLYDALNRMSRITQTASGGLSVADKRIDIAYNEIGQFESITRYSDTAGTQLVVGTTYEYDSLNRLERIAHDNSTSTVAFYDYVYDSDSRITRITDVDGETNYTYDDRDQLTGADHADGSNPDESYEYDANGNRIDSHLHGGGYVTGPANRLMSDGTYDYEYDAEGNRVLQSEMATGDYRGFEYDHRNRLVAVVDYSSGGIVTQSVQFSYDALGRRISKTVDGALAYFVYDGIDVLLDFEDLDGIGGNSPVFSQRYLHGPTIDQVLVQEAGAGEVLWLLADHLGTTRHLVVAIGQVANHLKYDSFGNVVEQSDDSKATRFQFTGREFESELDLYMYRSRFFDSSVGRFVSEDTLGFVDGPNLRTYVLNSPVGYSDPFGTQTVAQPTGVLGRISDQLNSILDGVGSPQGKIQGISGDDCWILSGGKRKKAKKGDTVRHGDVVVTGDDTAAAVELNIGGRIGVKKGSSILIGTDGSFSGLRDGVPVVPQLKSGGLWAKFAKQDKGKRLTIQTRGGILGIRDSGQHSSGHFR